MKKDNSALSQDREMLERGMRMEELYDGYFSSRKNCQAILPHIPREMFEIKNPVIIDAGSSEGTLGVFVKEEFKKHGCNPRLILIDANATALEKSKAVAEKVVANLKNLSSIKSESINLVLLRSVLQYEDYDRQAMILKEILRILSSGGILVSQFGSIPTRHSNLEVSMFNGIFENFGRKVTFCSTLRGIALHGKIFSNISSAGIGPTLYESLTDFSHRVNASSDEISKAEEYIKEYALFFDHMLTSKQPPYAWKIPYTIVSCRKW